MRISELRRRFQVGKFLFLATLLAVSAGMGSALAAPPPPPPPPDTTAPTCGTWNPPANPSAWSNNASITFTHSNAFDGGSGLRFDNPTQCSENTNGQQCSIVIRDNAGNSRTCFSPVARIDRTPPECSAWQMNPYPASGGSSYSPWNGNYDIVSIPFTGLWKLIYAQGNDPSGIPGEGQSGMANGNEFHCDVENPPGSDVDMCFATIRDNAGNMTDCGRGTSFNGPRSRIDRSLPPKPQISCIRIDAETSRYRCDINPSSISGPSAAMLYWSRSTTSATSGFGSWILIGPVWYVVNATTSSLEMTGTQNLQFELSITAGTTEWIKIQAIEMPDTPHERSNVSDGYRIDAPTSPAPPPPVSGTPAAQVDGTQVLTYGPDLNDWYTQGCPGNLSWATLPDNPAASGCPAGTTYSVEYNVGITGLGVPYHRYNCNGASRCSWDSDGKWYPTTFAAGNGGGISCQCFDNNPPVIETATITPAVWTSSSVTITSTINNPTENGAPFLGWTTNCNGTPGPSGAGSSISFTCNTDSTGPQTGTIQACDAASQCTTRTFKYYRETTPPTGDFTITGDIHNHFGHGESPIPDSTSNTYTWNPVVRLAVSGVNDAGGSNLHLNPIQFSCSATPDLSGTWEAVPGAPINFDLTTRPGCNVSRGLRTAYMHVRDWAGNVHTVSHSITFDDAKPTFDSISNALLKARDNYVYSIQNPADTGGSNLRDFSITWEEGGGVVGTIDNTGGGFSFDFGTIAKTLDADGKRNGEIKISLEDNAGNFESKIMSFTLVAGDINFTNSSVVVSPSDSPMVGDLSDEYTYSITLRDAQGNPVVPLLNIRHIQTDWEMDNQASFLGTSSFQDGALEYAWNSSTFVANDVPGYNRFQGIETSGDQFYFFKVRSAVPTVQGYPNHTLNSLRAGKIDFVNALPATCPSGYVCVGPNINPSYGSDLWDDLVSYAPGYLSFKAAMEVQLSKLSSNGEEWSTLTDGSWHPIQVKFVNNSNTQAFQTDRYKLNFQFTSDLGPFADLRFRPGTGWGLGTAGPASPSGSKSIPFTFDSSVLPTVNPSTTVVKNVEFQVNSYGYAFGKFGFTAFLPYSSSTNHVADRPDKDTGYNTENLGIPGILAFEQTLLPPGSIDIPVADFEANESSGQRISVAGSIADKGKNAGITAQGSVSIDTASLDRQSIKTNFRKNVTDLVRNIPPQNSATECSPTLPADLSGKDLYYYDFRNLTNPSPLNGNTGCTLRISGSDVTEGSGYRKLEISGVKTIVVIGGNVNVDTNVSYANGKSMLALVVLRDETVRTKGGNVYVNPSVTNVNAGAYVEGSVMSAEGTTVYDIDNTQEWNLTKQLLWFWSLYSANTVGGAVRSGSSWECPFGSDSYERTKSKNCSQAEASKYDFTFLRRFVLLNAATGSCAGKRTAKRIGTSYEEYAIAGEKQCFEDSGASVPNLKTTLKTTPFVVEYNSFIRDSGAKVFSVSK